MANTLTNLIPTIYKALDVVSREMVGFIPAVFKNSDAAQVAKNQTITYPISPASTAADVTPGITAPDSGDQSIGNATLTITKSRMVPIRWAGEEQRSIMNGGFYNQLLQDQFTQAFRTLANEIETDLGALYKTTSRAYGTAGTAPFGTAADLSDIANVRKILVDNGSGESDLRLVIDTAAGTNLRGKMSNLFKVNEAGSAEMLRQGGLGALQGFIIGESAGVAAHTKGTLASSPTISNAGHALGATTLNLTASVGTGTIVEGDVLTFAGENANYNYVVNTGDADVSNGGTIVLNKPGLRAAMSTATKAITIAANYRANMAFRKGAIHLVTRAPAMPVGPDGRPIDMADDIIYVTDPISGLTFQICLYRQYKQLKYEVGIAWGVANVKPEHTALLLG